MPTALRQRATTPRVNIRELLLTKHLGLVHHVAAQMSRTLSVRADFDELVSAGTMGLMSAIENFDATRGLAFSTFAAPRIRGAILDELRKQDHVPRSVRQKARDIAGARNALMSELGRAPEPREVAARLGVDVRTLWQWEADVDGAQGMSLDQPVGDGASTCAPADMIANSGPLADELLDREMEVARLRDALMRLKDQERTVLTLYYFEELKLHEIAEVLGVTESRVSQIRSKALARLRTQLAPHANVA